MSHVQTSGEVTAIEARPDGGAVLHVRFGDVDAQVFVADPKFLSEGLSVVANGRARRIEIIGGGE